MGKEARSGLRDCGRKIPDGKQEERRLCQLIKRADYFLGAKVAVLYFKVLIFGFTATFAFSRGAGLIQRCDNVQGSGFQLSTAIELPDTYSEAGKGVQEYQC